MKKQVQLQVMLFFLGAVSFGTYGQEPGLNDDFEQSGITYKVISTSPDSYEVEVVGNTNTGAVVIPPFVENVQNWKITSIGNSAFERDQLTSIDIPEGVTHIGDKAFADNAINSVVIPTTVTSIGITAFWNNRIASLEIPEGIAEIRDNTFGRNDLASVTIPASVTSIGGNAFITHPNSPSKMTRLIMLGSTPPTLERPFTNRGEIDVTIPDGAAADYLVNSDWNGFRTITEIPRIGKTFTIDSTEVNIPATYTITSLAPYEVELSKYNGLAGEVAIPETVATYAVVRIGSSSFKKGQFHPNKLKRVTIPNSVRSIGREAFSLNQLIRVTIPGSVESIELAAFHDNFALEDVEMLHTETDTLEMEGFVFRNNKLTRVTLLEGMEVIRGTTFAGNLLTSIDGIPNSVITIGNNAFDNNQLRRVTIPENVKNIGLWSFARNPDITRVEVKSPDPPNVMEIPEPQIPDNNFTPGEVREKIFTGGGPDHEDLRGKIDLIVPARTKNSYQNHDFWSAFRSITESPEIGGTFTVDNTVYEITSLAPNTVRTIDNHTSQASAIIPPMVSNGPNTYRVTAIGEGTFFNSVLHGIEMPNSVTSIGSHAFRNSNLEEVTLPDGVAHIRTSAFQDNQLSSVIIPNNVTYIANWAFADNPITQVISRNETPPTLGSNSFTNRDQVDLVVPTGRRQAYLDHGWHGFRSISEGSNTLPQPTIDAPQSVDNLESFTVNITFGGEVTGFELGDIQVTHATVKNLTGSGSAYTATLEPTSACDGNITIDVPANVATGVNHLSNPAATQVSVGTVDTIDPTIAGPADVVANTSDNSTGDCTITVDLGSPVTDDNCSVATVVAQVNGTEIDPVTYTFGTGTTTVTWIVSDGAGNTASSEQTVTVEEPLDNLVAMAKDITVQLDDSGQVTILPEDVDNGSAYGCGSTPELSLDIDTFDCDDVGNPVTVTLTAAYGNNTATAIALVTVQANGSCELGPIANFNRGFSPNGDGIADTLVIEGLEKFKNNVVRIYNLSQRLVFSAHYGGPGDAWDGTDENGMVPVGSYVCVIDYNEPGLGHEAKMIYVNY